MYIGKGNKKLGKKIYTWSIPAVTTCPGRSSICESVCYADSGFFSFKRIKDGLLERLKLSMSDKFVEIISDEINKVSAKVFRIHVSGDFYSCEYVDKWNEIVKKCANTKFFVFTRSWRIPEIREKLVQLSKNSNITIWLSCDDETGIPSLDDFSNTKISYLSVNDEPPPTKVDLVFRIRKNRKDKIIKKIGLSMVCPAENGVTNVVCDKCKFCWR